MVNNKTGRFALIEQLLADDIHYMFGNPGTVEQGFLDALGDYPAMHYILTLQETIAVMAADGYARATKKPALVQITVPLAWATPLAPCIRRSAAILP